MRLRAVLFSLILAVAPRALRAQVAEPLLYHHWDYGSQSTFSPATMLMNVGFEDFLASLKDRRLGDFPLRSSARALWTGVAHPIESIHRFGGWKPWLDSEILPLELSPSAGWVPNYFTHLVSGSLQTRMLAEWYAAHGAPAPKVLGSLTFLTASYLHEMVQFPYAHDGSATSIADLYVFDLPASILGNFGGMPSFLVKHLDAANWAPMVSPVLPEGDLTNVGDYWIYKVGLPRTHAVRLFARVGYGTQFGLTHRLGGGRSISAAVGFDTDTRSVDPVTLDESVTAVRSMWVSLDRNNSLLASVNLSGRREDRLIVNVYPGVLPGPVAGIGVWLVADASGRTRVGLASRRALGLGVGHTVVHP
jgi:hypothetical protein